MLGSDVLVGLGLGFGYSSATPPPLKWFPPAFTGRIAGLGVAGKWEMRHFPLEYWPSCGKVRTW